MTDTKEETNKKIIERLFDTIKEKFRSAFETARASNTSITANAFLLQFVPSESTDYDTFKANIRSKANSADLSGYTNFTTGTTQDAALFRMFTFIKDKLQADARKIFSNAMKELENEAKKADDQITYYRQLIPNSSTNYASFKANILKISKNSTLTTYASASDGTTEDAGLQLVFAHIKNALDRNTAYEMCKEELEKTLKSTQETDSKLTPNAFLQQLVPNADTSFADFKTNIGKLANENLAAFAKFEGGTHQDNALQRVFNNIRRKLKFTEIQTEEKIEYNPDTDVVAHPLITANTQVEQYLRKVHSILGHSAPFNETQRFLLTGDLDDIDNWLTENAKNINTTDNFGLSPLDYLALSGRFKYTSIPKYKKHGWKIDEDRFLNHAILSGNVAMLSDLLDKAKLSFSFSHMDKETLQMAAVSKNPVMFDYCIWKYNLHPATVTERFENPVAFFKDEIPLILPELIISLAENKLTLSGNLESILGYFQSEISQALLSVPNTSLGTKILQASLNPNTKLGALLAGFGSDFASYMANIRKLSQARQKDQKAAAQEDIDTVFSNQFDKYFPTPQSFTEFEQEIAKAQQTSVSLTTKQKKQLLAYICYNPEKKMASTLVSSVLQPLHEDLFMFAMVLSPQNRYNVIDRIVRNDNLLNIFSTQERREMIEFYNSFSWQVAEGNLRVKDIWDTSATEEIGEMVDMKTIPKKKS